MPPKVKGKKKSKKEPTQKQKQKQKQSQKVVVNIQTTAGKTKRKPPIARRQPPSQQPPQPPQQPSQPIFLSSQPTAQQIAFEISRINNDRPRTIAESEPRVTINPVFENRPVFQPTFRPDISPIIAPDIRPDIRPEIRTDIRPDISPVIAPDIRPDISPFIAPDISPFISPFIQPQTQINPNIQPQTQINPQVSFRNEINPSFDVTPTISKTPDTDTFEFEFETPQRRRETPPKKARADVVPDEVSDVFPDKVPIATVINPMMKAQQEQGKSLYVKLNGLDAPELQKLLSEKSKGKMNIEDIKKLTKNQLIAKLISRDDLQKELESRGQASTNMNKEQMLKRLEEGTIKQSPGRKPSTL